MDILTSLHGRQLGLDQNQLLVAPNGLASGTAGIQVVENSHLVLGFTDDFMGDLLSAEWDAKTGSDGAVTTPTINVQKSGVVRMITGAGAGATMAVNGVQLQSSLNYSAPAQYQQIRTAFQTRLKLSAITNIAVFVGFTNQTTSLQIPINGAGGGDTFTNNATDAVGFLFDTTMTTKNWWEVGVSNSVGATGQNTGIAPVAATYDTLRVELETDNSTTGATAYFYRNGVMISGVGVSSAMVNAIRNSQTLTPIVAAFTRSAASANVDIDYIHCSMARQ